MTCYSGETGVLSNVKGRLMESESLDERRPVRQNRRRGYGWGGGVSVRRSVCFSETNTPKFGEGPGVEGGSGVKGGLVLRG